MAILATTPPGSETTRAILEQIVRGERGRQLRAKVAAANRDVDRSRVDDAFQTACERAGVSCRGQSEGEVYKWLLTTMTRELGAARKRLEREQPVDWTPESLSRFRRSENSVADELVERETEGELIELSTQVLDDLTDAQRAVAVLYSHGLQRKEIAAQLDVTPRVVKRSLERLLSAGRRRLIDAAGGGCDDGEPLIARYSFGLGTAREVKRAQMHLATCPRCAALYERLGIWREQVAATVPIPAVVGSHPHAAEQLVSGSEVAVGHGAAVAEAPVAPRGPVSNVVAHAREHLAGLYARTFDPTPLAGARPGAVAAAVAGCLAVGTSATYCVDQNVDLGAITRFAGISAPEHKHHAAKHHKPRAHVAQVATPTPTVAPVAAPTPQPTTTQAVPPPTTTTTAATPPPAPEDQFQPTSAGANSSSTTTASAASAPAQKPNPAPANGAPEFGGP